MSELELDVADVEAAMCRRSPSAYRAWQRIRARLTPNRERVARAIRDVMIYHTGDESSLREKLTDAAIDAMKETP